jgi:hypothetical protein
MSNDVSKLFEAYKDSNSRFVLRFKLARLLLTTLSDINAVLLETSILVKLLPVQIKLFNNRLFETSKVVRLLDAQFKKVNEVKSSIPVKSDIPFDGIFKYVTPLILAVGTKWFKNPSSYPRFASSISKLVSGI